MHTHALRLVLYVATDSNGLLAWVPFLSSVDKSNQSSHEGRQVKMPVGGDFLDTDVIKDSDTSLTEKLLGQYEVTIDRLKEPDEKYLCRQVKDGWVEIIKQKIRAHPAPVTTIVPVLVDPQEVPNIEDFDSQKVSTYTYMMIGGSHRRAAIKIAVEKDENIKEIIGKINVLVYASLTEEQAQHIGNVHNIKCKTLDFTFQFFRSLQRVAESVKIFYLRKVSADIKSGLNITTEIEKWKRKLEDIFTKLTNCSSWEEAKMMYPEHAERGEDFLDLHMSTKYIPQGLVDFCKEALLEDSIPEVTVEITILKNDVIVENNNLIKLLKRKVVKELKGNKRLRSLLDDEERELELQPQEEN